MKIAQSLLIGGFTVWIGVAVTSADPLLPRPALGIVDQAGIVDHTIQGQNVVVIRSDGFGPFLKVKATPRSIILVQDKPISASHLFVNDRADLVRYNKDTNELIKMIVRRH